jgi:transcriptional regulator CtsR
MSDKLADFIEKCILGKFAAAREELLMRRNDLALELSCAPSQISYVLNTRFTPERGFMVKSRRGAGGFVRIVRMPRARREDFSSADEFLAHLLADKAISVREYALLSHLLEINSPRAGGAERFALLQEALRRMVETT